jgi:hypothetical protein
MRKNPVAGGNGAPRDVYGSQGCPVDTPPSPTAQVVRAEIIGQGQATAAGITVSGRHAPVLALCRALIEAGHDPATPLEAYRGTTLCLRVRSIGEGARLRVAAHGVGFERDPECTAAPPAAQTAEGVHPVARCTGEAVCEVSP